MHVAYIAFIFKLLAVFECYSILSNSVTCGNLMLMKMGHFPGIVQGKNNKLHLHLILSSLNLTKIVFKIIR